MARFIPGLDLGQRFFEETAKPILEAQFPGLRYSAALIGWGSEVLGYDDPQCTTSVDGGNARRAPTKKR